MRTEHSLPRMFRVIATSFLAFAFCAPDAVAAEKMKPAFKQAQEYAFAACMAQRFKGAPIGLEADAWASGIIEFGDLVPKQYAALARLSMSLPEPGVTRSGAVMRLQGCFDLINSHEFSRQAHKILLNKD